MSLQSSFAPTNDTILSLDAHKEPSGRYAEDLQEPLRELSLRENEETVRIRTYFNRSNRHHSKLYRDERTEKYVS